MEPNTAPFTEMAFYTISDLLYLEERMDALHNCLMKSESDSGRRLHCKPWNRNAKEQMHSGHCHIC